MGLSTISNLRRPSTAIQRGGKPIEPQLRHAAEARFGHDFSQVRIHRDNAAQHAAAEIGAAAFAVGNDILFAAGRYAPGSEPGQRLLGHELAHIVQQSRGGPPAENEPSLETAAQAAGRQFAAATPVAVAGNSAPGIAREPAGIIPVDIGEAFRTEAWRRSMQRALAYNPFAPHAAPTPAPKPTPPPTPPPAAPEPAPPPAVEPPGDPQAATPTSGPYLGGPGQDPGKVGLSMGGQRLWAGSGTSATAYGLNIGLAGKDGLGGLELVGGLSTQGDATGTVTGATAGPLGLHAFLAPQNRRYNLAAYGGVNFISGQTPPGTRGVNWGAGGTVVGEGLAGGIDRDHPRWVFGANLSAGYQRFVNLSALGSSAAVPPSTFLAPAGTVGGVGSAQLNLGYYLGADGKPSKTPAFTGFLEGGASYAWGAPYRLPGSTDPATSGTSGNSLAAFGGLGAFYNARLDGGRTILSLGAFGGIRNQRDQIGGQTTNAFGPYGGLTFGLAWRPENRKREDRH